MPNWVYNGLTIEGSPDSVNALIEQLNQPFTKIHDNWNTETMQMEKKRVIYSKPTFAFWNIVKPTDLEAYNGPQPTVDLSKPIRFDSNHWYDWNVRNWGTKWDVANQDVESVYNDTYMEGPVENGGNLAVYYNFNTAWGVPEAALVNLSSQYPTLLFTLNYQEETGWGGEMEILRGNIISHGQYDSRCNECEANDTLEYCEDCENDVCSFCGYGTSEEGCEAHPVEVNA